MTLNEKEVTLPVELLEPIFKAKNLDLLLANTDDQLRRFTENSCKRNVNGKLIYIDMKLGIQFATGLAQIFFE